MGSLAQISSGAIRCSFNTRFWTSFRRFWCRYPVRFRRVPVTILAADRVPVQIPCEVLEVSGAGTWLGSKGFWCRYLVRFRKFPVQLHDDVPEGLGEDAR